MGHPGRAGSLDQLRNVSGAPIPAAAFPKESDVQARADAARGPAPEMREDLLGPVTIETYAVHYDRQGAPRGGAVMGRAADGARTLAHVRPEDAALIAFLTDGAVEPVGTAGGVAQADGKRIFTRE